MWRGSFSGSQAQGFRYITPIDGIWAGTEVDTPPAFSQGILDSTTAACTSEVLRNVPKRIGSGMPYPTKAWPMDHLWAIFY